MVGHGTGTKRALRRSAFLTTVSFLAVLALALPSPAGAQGAARTAPSADGPDRNALRSFNLPGAPDPPAPTAPEVIVRGENGRVVIRATKLTQPLSIDGVLDEAFYRDTPPITGFIQTVPREGAESTEKTEAWVSYDDKFFYVTCRCWESAPPEQWTANEYRRDTAQLRQNDIFGALLDTFHDRRNGFHFYANPLGARADQVVSNEGNPNSDWNPVWFVRTGRFEGGWTSEIAIPFRSIRYISGPNQEWGIQIRRSIRRKNEWTHITFIPAATGGVSSIFRVSAAATLVGLDLPPAARNIELKPYAISRLTSDLTKTPAVNNSLIGTGGLDAKYGISANLTADLTVNTDFAQVEVDEQQVNLTRFPIVFPEKRDFFLEGRGTFEFARPTTQGGFTGQTTINNNAPQLFFTRRIGLNNGRQVPIMAGGRVTGTVGRTAIGLMNMETGYETTTGLNPDACRPPYSTCTPRTNYSVVRVRRDILRRSNIGVLFTNRSNSPTVDGANQSYGIDGAFSFFQNISANAYYARSESPNRAGDEDSYQARFEYGADRYGFRADYLDVGTNFYPEVGFVQRRGFSRGFMSGRFSPRMPRGRRVRRYLFEAAGEYVVNRSRQIESSSNSARFLTEDNSSDQIILDVSNDQELLVRPFTVARGVSIQPGDYRFSSMTASYAFGQQRRASGTVALRLGQFYDGLLSSLTVSGARVALTKQFSVEPSVTLNRGTLTAGDFTTALLRTRVDYAFTPLRFLSALVQYSSNDRTFSSNVRFRWEYRPGSEVFIVYTDERDTTVRGYPGLRNRAFVVKVNRLFQF